MAIKWPLQLPSNKDGTGHKGPSLFPGLLSKICVSSDCFPGDHG